MGSASATGGRMVTHWFTDVPVPGHDRNLVRALSAAVRWLDDEEPPCRIGLLREDGRLYRIVVAHGEPQRRTIEATLRASGYRMAASPEAIEGRLHAVFRFEPAHGALGRTATDPPAGIAPAPDVQA